jgi:GNAT superfamily N-acetyltransferase
VTRPILPGQDTLVACWRALARLSPGAEVLTSPLAYAAVFPSWAPLNNAIVADRADDAAVDAVRSLFGEAGVDGWALWVPSREAGFGAPDALGAFGDLERDTTTLVMHAALPDLLPLRDGVVRTSIASVVRVEGEPLPAHQLEPPDAVPGLSGWALVRDGAAVSAAWSYLHGTDCGIYAVETVPAWRRRGMARTLLEHVLADAQRRGARTASLQSTPMGQPLYESLGFRAAGRYEEWISPTPRAASSWSTCS